MNYTYFLYDTTKTALPLTDMFAKSKTEEKTEDSTKPTVGTYNSLNTLKRPLLKPSPLNRVTPSELSETEPAEKGAEAVEPAKTEDPVEPAPEAPKKEKKNAASIILSIYYYLNILFIVGFCISLLWSVDILMGFEIIMVLISINIGKWGVCLVYNAIFLICRLMVSIYFDSNVYRWILSLLWSSARRSIHGSVSLVLKVFRTPMLLFRSISPMFRTPFLAWLWSWMPSSTWSLTMTFIRMITIWRRISTRLWFIE